MLSFRLSLTIVIDFFHSDVSLSFFVDRSCSGPQSPTSTPNQFKIWYCFFKSLHGIVAPYLFPLDLRGLLSRCSEVQNQHLDIRPLLYLLLNNRKKLLFTSGFLQIFLKLPEKTIYSGAFKPDICFLTCILLIYFFLCYYYLILYSRLKKTDVDQTQW